MPPGPVYSVAPQRFAIDTPRLENFAEDYDAAMRDTSVGQSAPQLAPTQMYEHHVHHQQYNDMRHLHQQVQVAMQLNDPRIVAEAMQALNAAHQQQQEIMHQAQLAVSEARQREEFVRHQAQSALLQAQAQAASEVDRVQREADQRLRVLEHQAEKHVLAEKELITRSLTDERLKEHQQHQSELQRQHAEALKQQSTDRKVSQDEMMNLRLTVAKLQHEISYLNAASIAVSQSSVDTQMAPSMPSAPLGSPASSRPPHSQSAGAPAGSPQSVAATLTCSPPLGPCSFPGGLSPIPPFPLESQNARNPDQSAHHASIDQPQGLFYQTAARQTGVDTASHTNFRPGTPKSLPLDSQPMMSAQVAERRRPDYRGDVFGSSNSHGAFAHGDTFTSGPGATSSSGRVSTAAFLVGNPSTPLCPFCGAQLPPGTSSCFVCGNAMRGRVLEIKADKDKDKKKSGKQEKRRASSAVPHATSARGRSVPLVTKALPKSALTPGPNNSQ